MLDLCSAGWGYDVSQWSLEEAIIDGNVRTIGAIARDRGLLPDYTHLQTGAYLCESAGEHILRSLGLNRADLLNDRFEELAAVVDRFSREAA